MAVIWFTEKDSWVMARWAYHMIMTRVAANVTTDGDAFEVVQSEAMDCLAFDDMQPPERGERLAAALLSAATSLREDLLATPSDDPRDAGLARILGEIMAAVGVHYPHLRDQPDPGEST